MMMMAEAEGLERRKSFITSSVDIRLWQVGHENDTDLEGET